VDIAPPSDLTLADETFRIRKAAFQVGNGMGYGFLEAVYHECLVVEFEAMGIPFQSMPKLGLSYGGVRLR
jgi:GxxExxY protein